MEKPQIKILKSDPVGWKSAQNIIDLATLPDQIYFSVPYHLKASFGEEYLKSLPKELRELYYEYINEQVSGYFESGGS